jgi:dTDP-4-amino-4,6-dideoxygalactose transaminase
MAEIYITSNRIDKLLLPEYVKELIKKIKHMKVVDDHTYFLSRFEKTLAEFIGVKDSLLTNSGTDAIHLSLLSFKIGKDDEVILPATTYISVALAVWYTGAKLVPVDISEEDMLIDIEKIKERITSRTKAIIMVHMFGQSCKVKEILEIGREYNVKIIENICQAIGTIYKGKRLGGYGDVGVVSFRYAKTISSLSGNGGAILLKNSQTKRFLKEQFLDIYRGEEGLFNINRKFCNISFFDALVTFVKLKHFEEIERKKILCRKIYEDKLRDVKEVKIFPDPPGVCSVRPFFLILARKRNLLMEYLSKKGILCEASYPPIVSFPRFGRFNPKEFPVAFKHWKMGLRLPLFPFMEPEEAEIVTQEIKNFYAKNI